MSTRRTPNKTTKPTELHEDTRQLIQAVHDLDNYRSILNGVHDILEDTSLSAEDQVAELKAMLGYVN